MEDWTPPTTRSTGYIVLATDYNVIENNLQFLYDRVLYKKTTAKTVNGTTSATDLLNGEVTLAAGVMRTDAIVKLTAWGDFKNATTTAQDVPSFLLGLGGTTLIETGNSSGSVVDHVTDRFGWRFVCEIQNLGAANSQQAWLSGTLGYQSAASSASLQFTTGNGLVFADGIAAFGRASYDGGHSAAVDTTAACALTFKVANANNSGNYETKLLGALIELL